MGALIKPESVALGLIYKVMFGSVILDVAIGIIFVYILVSKIFTSIRAAFESLLKARAAYLEDGIPELLHYEEGTKLASAFYNHPLIYSLFSKQYTPSNCSERLSILKKGNDLPSYIPARDFALTIMDIAARGSSSNEISSGSSSRITSLESMRMNLSNLGNP